MRRVGRAGRTSSSSAAASPGWRRHRAGRTRSRRRYRRAGDVPRRAGRRLARQRPTTRRLTMNRGFHAFFRQYYNLRTLLRRIDSELGMLVPVEDYPLVDATGPARHVPRPSPDPAVQRVGVRRCAARRSACATSPGSTPARRPRWLAVSVPESITDSTTSTPTTSCVTSTSPRGATSGASRCSPAASSPSPPTCRPPSWRPCSTSTSWAPARA